MVLLEPITTEQTIKFLADINKEDLPLANATFEFLDSYSGQTITETADIVRSGFVNAATITVDLQDERRYQLSVSHGGSVIFRDTVFVSSQVEVEGTDNERVASTESYSLSNNQWVLYNDVSPNENKNRFVLFNDIR